MWKAPSCERAYGPLGGADRKIEWLLALKRQWHGEINLLPGQSPNPQISATSNFDSLVFCISPRPGYVLAVPLEWCGKGLEFPYAHRSHVRGNLHPFACRACIS
jgi:hypothetical protein